MVQDGWTALMMATNNGHDDIVDLLVKAGARLDVQNKVGGQWCWTRTPHLPTHLGLGPPIRTAPLPPLLPYGDRPELL